jgi:hypothetical protein
MGIQIRGSQVPQDWATNFNYTLLTREYTEKLGLAGRYGSSSMYPHQTGTVQYTDLSNIWFLCCLPGCMPGLENTRVRSGRKSMMRCAESSPGETLKHK